VAAHAIGDRAIDLALDAFGTAQERYPRRDPRHRIEHFAASRPDQVIIASERGVLAVPQGRFCTELGDASKAEHVKGTITPGKLADFVVLAEDPTAVSPDRIAALEVLATIIGGELAYSALSSGPALWADAIVLVRGS
jgi:predicted amidohydrolase YtcJ